MAQLEADIVGTKDRLADWKRSYCQVGPDSYMALGFAAIADEEWELSMRILMMLPSYVHFCEVTSLAEIKVD